MSRTGMIFAFAVTALILTSVVLIVRMALRTPCEEIGSWEECDSASHCSTVRLFVSDEHKGPIWECEDR